MIQYIGNYADWIPDTWCKEVLSNPGFEMPKHSLRNEARFNPILREFIQDISYIHTKEDYLNIQEHLNTLDPNNKAVKHAKIHIDYLDPDREMGEEYDMYTNSGYDVYANHFSLLEKFDLSFDLLDNPPPFLDYKGKHITWWFSTMKPGDLMPVHTDRAKPDIPINKYWMPWTDYEPGHIFIIGDKEVSNYKKGDVYKFDYAGDWHGACNLGTTNRCILQIVDYKPSRNIDGVC